MTYFIKYSFVLLLIITASFSSPLKADCTITGTVFASNDPFAGCTGVVTIEGTLNIDIDYDVSAYGITTVIVSSTGLIDWTGNKKYFNLPTGAALQVEPGGVLKGNGARDKLQFGGTTVANPPGNGGNLSFQEVMDAGGVDANGLLPVELISFKVRKDNDQVKVLWQTATEFNNEYFELQHSTDGRHFSTIAKIQGAGSSYEVLNYSYVHESPSENNYYQLKQVDFDGKSSFTTIEYILVESKSKTIRLFPTVATQQLTVLINNFEEDVEVEIIDSAGRILKSTCLTSSRTPLNVSNLPSGTYWVRKVTASSIESQIFIKK